MNIKRLVLLIIVTGLCVLPAVYLGGTVGWLPLIFIILFTVISCLYAVYLTYRISISCKNDSSIFIHGSDAELCFEAVNRSVLYCFTSELHVVLSAGIGDGFTIPFTLAPKERRLLSAVIKMKHIGEYTLNYKVHIKSLLGIAQFRSKQITGGSFVIIPRSDMEISLQTVSGSESENAVTRNITTLEGTFSAGARQYVPGDPMKLIHWKLSSHIDEYMTRLPESYTQDGVTILPYLIITDFDPETRLNAFDMELEAVAAVCKISRERGTDFDICFTGHDGVPYRLSPYDSIGFAEFIRYISPIGGGIIDITDVSHVINNNIVIVTSDINEHISSSVLQLSASRKRVTVLLAIPESVYGEPRSARLRQLGRLEHSGVTVRLI